MYLRKAMISWKSLTVNENIPFRVQTIFRTRPYAKDPEEFGIVIPYRVYFQVAFKAEAQSAGRPLKGSVPLSRLLLAVLAVPKISPLGAGNDPASGPEPVSNWVSVTLGRTG
jgi:hypothetical protein